MNKKQKGFTLIELLIVVAIILIIAAIAIPKLVAARQSGQIAHAVGNTRTLFTAVVTFQSKFNNDFPSTAAQLMAPGNTCDASGMYPAPLGGPAFSWVEQGYTYTYNPITVDAVAATGCTDPGASAFTWTAVPVDPTLDAMYIDQTGTIRHQVGVATVASNPLGQ